MMMITVDYDRGLKEGMDIGVSTMCEFRDLLLARIRDHIESENPDLALALINNILGESWADKAEAHQQSKPLCG